MPNSEKTPTFNEDGIVDIENTELLDKIGGGAPERSEFLDSHCGTTVNAVAGCGASK